MTVSEVERLRAEFPQEGCKAMTVNLISLLLLPLLNAFEPWLLLRTKVLLAGGLSLLSGFGYLDAFTLEEQNILQQQIFTDKI